MREAGVAQQRSRFAGGTLQPPLPAPAPFYPTPSQFPSTCAGTGVDAVRRAHCRLCGVCNGDGLPAAQAPAGLDALQPGGVHHRPLPGKSNSETGKAWPAGCCPAQENAYGQRRLHGEARHACHQFLHYTACDDHATEHPASPPPLPCPPQVGTLRLGWSFFAGALGAWVIATPASYTAFPYGYGAGAIGLVSSNPVALCLLSVTDWAACLGSRRASWAAA